MDNIKKRLTIETEKAAKENEVPIGCVVVREGKIISSGHNQRIKMSDPLAHAEIIAIKKAAKKLKTWNLLDCELYVTLKPCKMCQEIIRESRVKKVYYILENFKNVGDNVEYISLTKIEDNFDYKEKIIDFFRSKR